MTEIPDRPFDKIAIDLVMECKTSTSGNKHILTIIDHLMGWPETFPIPDNSADTIVLTFINQYLPVHMCSRYILSDNGTEFKNTLMDRVLKQLGQKDLSNWDKYINQILAGYRVTPNLSTAETQFFLVYGRDPTLPLHQPLEPMQ